tara:strand:+ start:4457 stop:5218 length:762 start_codon:yes stop_codon:yes gene_type:complete
MKTDLLTTKSGSTNNIKIVRYMDIKGNITKKYCLNGIPLQFVEISNRHSKKASGFQLIINDLEYIEKYLTHLINNSTFAKQNYDPENNEDHFFHMLTCTSFISSAIMLYAKCFTKADKRGTTLSKKDHIECNMPHLSNVHDFIIHLRHQYYAHSGHSNIESAAMRVVFHDNGSVPVVNAEYHLQLSLDFFMLFIELVQKLKSQVSSIVFKIANGQYDEYIKNKSEQTHKKNSFGIQALTWEIWSSQHNKNIRR